MDLTRVAISFKNGNIKAFDILYKEGEPIARAAVFNYVKNKDDIDDLIQIIFLKVNDNISKFESKSFENWLYTISKNTAIDFIREKKIELIENVDILSDEFKNPIINIALSKLDPLEKEIFLMKVLLNSSIKSLSKIFNLSSYDIRKMYFSAKEKLKKELKDL